MIQTKNILKKEITKEVCLNYLLYLPDSYAEKRKWPLILFLHGAGERGSDVEIVKRHGIPKVIENNGNFPFIAVSPQCPENSDWENKFDELHALLDEIADNYSVDEDRVYLTGLSMGGFGTWDFAMMHPERFAAIIPICGGTLHHLMIKNLKEIPVWAFHGAKDSTVPVENTRVLVSTLKELGGDIRYTEYPDLGHDSWTVTYSNKKIFKWLLEHKRK